MDILKRLNQEYPNLRDDLYWRAIYEDRKAAANKIRQLRRELREHGDHKPWCNFDPCDCGLDEALKK